jgi:hypothetical protein
VSHQRVLEQATFNRQAKNKKKVSELPPTISLEVDAIAGGTMKEILILRERTDGLRLSILSTNNVIPLDHRGHTHSRASVFQALLDADDLS